MAKPPPDREHFYRANLACALCTTEFGLYWGYVGLPEGHRHYKSSFVRAGPTRLFKAMAPDSNPEWDKLWWLGFEGNRPYSYAATLAELKAAADLLGQTGTERS